MFFYPQKEKAEQINSAIINILEKDHQFYHGENENIEVKILINQLLVKIQSLLIYG